MRKFLKSDFFKRRETKVSLALIELPLIMLLMMLSMHFFCDKIYDLIPAEKYNDYTSVFVGVCSRTITTIILMIAAALIGVVKEIEIGLKKLPSGLFCGSAVFLYSAIRIAANYLRNNVPGNEIVFEKFLALAVQMLVVGIFEEYAFRGVIFEKLRKTFPTIKDGIGLIIIQGILFGALHINNYYTGVLDIDACKYQMAIASFMGIFLGTVYQMTGSLASTMVLHGFYDFAVSFGQTYSSTSDVKIDFTANDLIILVVVIIICYLISLLMGYFNGKKEYARRNFFVKYLDVDLKNTKIFEKENQKSKMALEDLEYTILERSVSSMDKLPLDKWAKSIDDAKEEKRMVKKAKEII